MHALDADRVGGARMPGARRHATVPQSWMQRENWEFETHTCSVAPAEGPEKCGSRRPTRSGYSCNNALDRNGDTVEKLRLAMDRSWQAFRRSVQDGTAVSCSHSTSFVYELAEHGCELVRTGLPTSKAAAGGRGPGCSECRVPCHAIACTRSARRLARAVLNYKNRAAFRRTD